MCLCGIIFRTDGVLSVLRTVHIDHHRAQDDWVRVLRCVAEGDCYYGSVSQQLHRPRPFGGDGAQVLQDVQGRRVWHEHGIHHCDGGWCAFTTTIFYPCCMYCCINLCCLCSPDTTHCRIVHTSPAALRRRPTRRSHCTSCYSKSHASTGEGVHSRSQRRRYRQSCREEPRWMSPSILPVREKEDSGQWMGEVLDF